MIPSEKNFLETRDLKNIAKFVRVSSAILTNVVWSSKTYSKVLIDKETVKDIPDCVVRTVPVVEVAYSYWGINRHNDDQAGFAYIYGTDIGSVNT